MQWHRGAHQELESQTAVQECQDPRLVLIHQRTLWPDNGEWNQMTWLRSFAYEISSVWSRCGLMYLIHQDYPERCKRTTQISVYKREGKKF